MDDLDRAQILEERTRELAISKVKSLIETERDHTQSLIEKGVTLLCKCCDEPLDGFISHYCDADCRDLAHEIRESERRNGLN